MKLVKRMLAIAMVVFVAMGAAFAEGDGYVIIGQASEVANLNPMEYPRTPDSNV